MAGRGLSWAGAAGEGSCVWSLAPKAELRGREGRPGADTDGSTTRTRTQIVHWGCGRLLCMCAGARRRRRPPSCASGLPAGCRPARRVPGRCPSVCVRRGTVDSVGVGVGAAECGKKEKKIPWKLRPVSGAWDGSRAGEPVMSRRRQTRLLIVDC